MKYIVTLLILVLFNLYHTTQAQSTTGTGNIFEDRFLLSLDGGITYAETDFKEPLTHYVLRGIFEYHLGVASNSTIGFRGIINSGYVAGEGGSTGNLQRAQKFQTRITLLGGGITFNYAATDFFIPYIGAGFNYINFEPEIKDENDQVYVPPVPYTPGNYTITGEAGLRFLIDESIILSLAGAVHHFPADDLDRITNEFSNGVADDIFFTGTIGVGLLIGGKKDSDGDGVKDGNDLCPDTPPGVKVDEFGCPVDSDDDGVPDYLDECPGTPAGYLVDTRGCIADTDGDGVPDDKDRCPYTPAGVEVDEFGCPIDSDGDGVPDYLDECEDTPEGNYVNEYGCVLWVPDFAANSNQKLVLYVDELLTGENELNSFAKSEMGFIVKKLTESGYEEWALVGHTDNQGEYMESRFRSLEWAKLFYHALAESGMDSTKIKFTGFGSEYPIAANSTEDGRSQNRRIEIFPILAATKTEAPEEIPEETQPQETDTPLSYGRTLPYNYEVEKNVTDVILTDGRNFCLQLSTWRDKKRAEDVARMYRAEGFNAFVTEAIIPNVSGYFYKVRVGFFASLAEARQANQAVSEIK